MDWNNLKDTVASMTLYDVKAGVRKVQNAVMNYTEMEAKVREATNNEPWGASSSLMQEIANGTFNYATLNEIMPMIYRRFTEKSAEEWRQIYKALQLLEFLIKHGSERVIDDARGHITLLKMLRQFHFIDQNGKDQGINVRNRAKELAELLSDVERIRTERKKARATKNKYTGVEGGMSLGGGFSGGSGSGSRYGGFGSESGGYGGYSGGVYGDGGGFGGQESNDYGRTQAHTDKFEEYDEFDDERPAASSSASRSKRPERAAAPKAEPPKKKEPEVDLFSFDDPAPTSVPAPAFAPTSSSGSGLGSLSAPSAANDDDEFDDFQSAAPVPGPAAAAPLSPPVMTANSATTFAAPQPVSAPQQANIGNMVSMSSMSPAPSANYSAFSTPAIASPAAQVKPSGYQPSGPNYFGSVQTAIPQSTGGSFASTPSAAAPKAASAKPGAAGGDAFGALWSQASTGVKKTSTPTAGPALGQLAKEKSSAGIWGAPAPASSASKPAGGASSSGGNHGLDDLLG
ncbi:Putative ENTH domain-containing protein [Colletotrichum destructivum]|uniref:ENTH domain-containing protein n=1 Tax=Colletotrichum destructivum TaxID=34406 RepID=A0AAX4IUT8_9PEZI|nr:Putative ENTH domain-containing protein [Colletotrichum destructivum]